MTAALRFISYKATMALLNIQSKYSFMVPVLHSSPVNPDGQTHWKLSSSRKFGLHVEFFTQGELLQGFCIRKQIVFNSHQNKFLLKNAAGCSPLIVNQQIKRALVSNL